jgi:hypothetical protein
MSSPPDLNRSTKKYLERELPSQRACSDDDNRIIVSTERTFWPFYLLGQCIVLNAEFTATLATETSCRILAETT